MFKFEELQEAAKELLSLDRENFGELTNCIWEQMDDHYDADKSLIRIIRSHINDEKELAIVNEVITALCGWSLPSIAKMMENRGCVSKENTKNEG